MVILLGKVYRGQEVLAVVDGASGPTYNAILMERGQGLVDLHQLLLARKAQMPEGSSTTRLLQQGAPKILEKCTEELGEVFQALLEQDADQVNLEVSQAIYHLTVLMIATNRGDMAGVEVELSKRESISEALPETLGLAIRNSAENMGKAFNALLSATSTEQQVNLTIASVIQSFQTAMKLAEKGSWEGVLEKL